MAHGPYDDFSRNGEKLCKLLKKEYYNRKPHCKLLTNLLMKLPCESPAPYRASNDTVAMDTGIGIINNPEILPATNQTSPESDAPPLECPHPISLINFMVS